jgi:uncharacterized protein (TIRG00374 family)
MRAIKIVLLIGGLAVMGALTFWIGAERIAASLSRITWWQFVIVCVPNLLTLPFDALAWRYAFAREPAPFGKLVAAGVAGEALNVVTAVASVGGEAIKAWLLRRDVRYEDSVPSLIIAKTTITIAQALYLALGIGLVWAMPASDSTLLRAMLGILVIEALAVGGFFLTQITGLVARAGRLLTRVGVLRAESYAEGLDSSLRGFYRRAWGRLLLSVASHLIGWMISALETFLILRFLGLPVSLGMATAIDALGSGVRFASFMVPASLGVLEGANVAAFAALGLGAEAGLAFSLVRRARQAVWIGLGLLVLFFMAPAAATRDQETTPASREV